MKWLKNLGWIKTAGVVLGMVLLGLAGAKAVKKKASGERKAALAKDLMNSGISKNIAKGKKMTDAANVDKDKAVKAEERMEAQLEKLSEGNQSIADIADRFNKRKLRKSVEDAGT